MSPRQTALGRLLQDHRESAGYSRTRIGELVGIKPGTIEGWSLAALRDPRSTTSCGCPHFLQVPSEEIQQAVFEDAGAVPAAEPSSAEAKRARPGGRPRRGAVPLLEAAFRLFGWPNEGAAAEAFGTSSERVRLWRTGAEQMAFADYLTLTSMIGVAAAEAMKGDDARIADLSAVAGELGLVTRRDTSAG